MKCLSNGADEQGSRSAVASQNLAIVTFENEMFGTIRTGGTPDNPLFCLADVCRVLDLRTDNVVKTLHLGDAPYKIGVIDSMGRPQQAVFITEPNLYKVIMRSNKPNAEPFQDWVCGEVLPQIRKTGGYIPVNAEDDEKTILAKAVLIGQRTMEQQKKIIAKQKGIIDDQKCEIGKLAPKAAVYDKIVLAEGTYTATQLAKEFGYSDARAFYKKLMEQKILFRQSNTYMPFKDWADKGLFSYRTRSIKHSDGTVEVKTYLVFTERFRLLVLRSRYRRAMNNI